MCEAAGGRLLKKVIAPDVGKLQVACDVALRRGGLAWRTGEDADLVPVLAEGVDHLSAAQLIAADHVGGIEARKDEDLHRSGRRVMTVGFGPEPLVDPQEMSASNFEGVFGFNGTAGRGAHGVSASGVGGEVGQVAGQLGERVVDEAGHTVIDELGHGADAAGDRRSAAGHGLQQGEAHELRDGVDIAVAVAVDGRENGGDGAGVEVQKGGIVGVGVKHDLLTRRQALEPLPEGGVVGTAADGEGKFGGESGDQLVDALVGEQATDVEDALAGGRTGGGLKWPASTPPLTISMGRLVR